jgi:general secretion pathway protein I
LFPTRPAPTDHGDAGFTIIEVLIALAVVAVSIVAIGSVMSTNVRGVRALEQHVTLLEATRSVMAADVPPRAEIGFGTWSGRTDGHQWRVDVSPMGGDEWSSTGEGAAWIPALVRVQVRSPSGAVQDVRTVRLIHGQAPQ